MDRQVTHEAFQRVILQFLAAAEDEGFDHRAVFETVVVMMTEAFRVQGCPGCCTRAMQELTTAAAKVLGQSSSSCVH